MNRNFTVKKYIPSKVKRNLKAGFNFKTRFELKDRLNLIKVYGKPKIFCIGLNKTGTTSLKKEMILQGFVVGNQRKAELLFDDWVQRDFRRIIRYCRTAQFFQDEPFSCPYTFIAMDQAFLGSKFILTIRDDAEQWYNSLIKSEKTLLNISLSVTASRWAEIFIL